MRKRTVRARSILKVVPHFFYLARCSDDSLYAGICTDIEARQAAHNGTGRGGAKYTRSRRPVQIVYTESFQTRSEALKREAAIKRWSKTQKESLVSPLTK